MEELDKYQYYKRWVQAKIARLKETKQYSEEKISELEKIYKIHEIEQKDTGIEL